MEIFYNQKTRVRCNKNSIVDVVDIYGRSPCALQWSKSPGSLGVVENNSLLESPITRTLDPLVGAH